MNISLEDLKTLKTMVWWTADKKKPYIVKGGVKNECYFILVSDLQSAWYRKADKETILDEKENYNRALQVQNFDGILDLLSQPISNHDKNADYTFDLLNNERNLLLELQTVINTYAFKWSFYLSKVKDEIMSDLITEDLINPLLSTLKATEMRINLIKKQFLDLETEYKRKLNDKDRASYKSKLEDGEDHWKFLVKDNPIDNKLTEFDLTDASMYFFKTYTYMKVKKQEELEEKLQREREKEAKDKALAHKRKADQISNTQRLADTAAAFADDYVESVDEINKKIQIESEMKKKDQKKAKKTKAGFL